MQLSIYEMLVGVVAAVSVGVNLFQLYRNKVNRQMLTNELANERRWHETILRSLWETMSELGSALGQLKRIGADGTVVVDRVGGAVNAQRIEIEEFLQNYYGVDIGQLASRLTQDRVGEESLELIRGKEDITNAMIDAAEKAEGYIFCVGGRSRNKRYLAAVSKRVLGGNVRYIRVITGDHIRHELHEHIGELFDHFELGYLSEDKYGGITVTHNTVILALYSSKVAFLDKGLKIVGEQIAGECREYVLELLVASNQPVELEFIRKLCTECKDKEGNQNE